MILPPAVLCIFVTVVMAVFEPLVNVESCTKSMLVLSTFEAADDGLIYIQGQDDSCKHPTTSGLSLYEFDFSVCDIKWEMLFRVVIQKNKEFQTGADKVIPIFCVVDRSDLVLSNVNNGQKDDDGSQNMTVRPSASMFFYKVVSGVEVSGTEVKLSDILIMTIQLDSQYINDFDIKARYCIASDIVIIENYCATDPDLFPNFSRFKTGYLMSEFGAFRPTTLDAVAVEMNFTCVLEVCADACSETYCGGGFSGWGRKRRESRTMDIIAADRNKASIGIEYHSQKKRRAINYDIGVGANVKLVKKYSDIRVVTEETMCMNGAILIIILTFLGAAVVGLGTSSIILFRKWTSAQKLTEQTPSGVSSIRKGLGSPRQTRTSYLEHSTNIY